MKNYKNIIYILLIPIFFCSCNEEQFEGQSIIDNSELYQRDVQSRNIIKEELALLTSRVIHSKNVRNEIINYVSVIDTNYYTVSISSLLKERRGLSYVEFENLQFLNSSLEQLIPTSFFKENLLFEIRRSKQDFPNLLNNLDPEIESDEGIIDLIVAADFSLFFGSFDEHDWLYTDQFYSTFVPDLEFEDDEEELFVNQFLIADDDDLPVCSCPPGSPAVGFQEYDDDFMDDYPSFSVEETCHDPNNDTYDSNTNLPSPVTTIKLDYDFNRFSLQSPSLLTAGIPQIQVGNSWRRKGSSRTRLRIQRVKINFAIGPGGTLIPVTSIDTFAENPSRKSGRRRWWRNVNWEWNNDVSQYEITHQMVVFQSWTGASDKDFEIPTKHTVDEDGNPQTEIDVIKLHDIFRSSSRNRGTLEMNWTNLAAYLVDGNPHCGSHDYCTREYDGVDYSTLDVNGNLRFFFNFYYTDLSN